MKRILITLSLCLCIQLGYSQSTLWSATAGSGIYGKGKIFNIDRSSGSYQLCYSFGKIDGKYPGRTNLLIADNGKVYGLLNHNNNQGNNVIIFEYDPANDKFNELTTFNSYVYGYMHSCLIQADNGKLYGNAMLAGDNFKGMLYEYDIQTNDFQELHLFTGAITNSDGERPMGNLLKSDNGLIYGTTKHGGSGYGTIYKIDPENFSYARLANFNSAIGKYPEDGLIQHTNGFLYGMTNEGGINNMGTIYKFNLNDNSIIKLYDFDGNNGAYPLARLTALNDDYLVGLTYEGGLYDEGVLFKYDIVNNTFYKLIDFNGFTHGANPEGSLIFNENNSVYGFTSIGGNYNQGCLFEYNLNTGNYHIHYHFQHDMGKNPKGSFSISPAGEYYGTTTYGGSTRNGGFLFKFDPASNEVDHLFAFGSNIEGETPHPCLIDAWDGKFYGVTHCGGKYDKGVFFSFDPQSGDYKSIESLTGGDTYNNIYNFSLTSDGQILCVSSVNGYDNNGLIFMYDPFLDDFQFLTDFDEDIIGKEPSGQLIPASNGLFYGRVNDGNVYDDGGIYSFDLHSNSLNCPFAFSSVSYQYSNYNLVPIGDDALYGIKKNYACGAYPTYIFKYNINSNELETVLDLTNTGADKYYSTLIKGGDDKIYGQAEKGGDNDQGYIYEFDTQNHQIVIKHHFNQLSQYTGIWKSELMMASNGKLYGMYGITSWTGLVYEYDPYNNLFKILDSIPLGGNGSNLDNVKFLEVINVGIAENSFNSAIMIYPNPFQNYVNIHNIPGDNMTIEVVDLTGKTVYRNNQFNSTSALNLDLSFLSNGVYILSLRSEYFHESRKIIKTN